MLAKPSWPDRVYHRTFMASNENVYEIYTVNPLPSCADIKFHDWLAEVIDAGVLETGRAVNKENRLEL